MHVGGVWVEICPIRWAHPPLQKAHWCQTISVPFLPEMFLSKRPPSPSHEATLKHGLVVMESHSQLAFVGTLTPVLHEATWMFLLAVTMSSYIYCCSSTNLNHCFKIKLLVGYVCIYYLNLKDKGNPPY